MTRQCILCSGYNSKKRKVEGNLIFNLEKKLLGIDQPYASKGFHQECLNHFLGHFPRNDECALYEIPLRVSYFEHNEIKEGTKPIWFLSKPIKFFFASGSRADGLFMFSDNWYRKLFGLTKTERTEIPASVKKTLSSKCQVCGNRQNLEIHHKIPLSLGGSNEKENLEVLCKNCHKLSGMEIPYPLDLTRILKIVLEKEYGIEIICYEMRR